MAHCAMWEIWRWWKSKEQSLTILFILAFLIKSKVKVLHLKSFLKNTLSLQLTNKLKPHTDIQIRKPDNPTGLTGSWYASRSETIWCSKKKSKGLKFTQSFSRWDMEYWSPMFACTQEASAAFEWAGALLFFVSVIIKESHLLYCGLCKWAHLPTSSR